MQLITTDDELVPLLERAKNVLLVEPKYERRYPPMGLAKIATFIQERDGAVTFRRGHDGLAHDLVCVGTVFTYGYADIRRALAGIRAADATVPILMGGPAASLIAQKFADTDVTIFKGYSKALDLTPLDLTLDWQVEEQWRDFSYVFTSRGCPNHCGYCAVWRIEAERWLNPAWEQHLQDKPNVIVFDNNLSACPPEHFQDIVNRLAARKLHVCFDNGFDVKYLTPEIARELGRLKYTHEGMRVAFDRIQEDGVFQQGVRMLLTAGIPKAQIMAYVLFNFQDTPQEADYRMRECHALGIRPYPQRYMPLSITTREQRYVGKHWTDNLAKAFRYFWLMPGIYRRMTFVEFLSSAYNKSFKMTHADMQAWRGAR